MKLETILKVFLLGRKDREWIFNAIPSLHAERIKEKINNLVRIKGVARLRFSDIGDFSCSEKNKVVERKVEFSLFDQYPENLVVDVFGNLPQEVSKIYLLSADEKWKKKFGIDSGLVDDFPDALSDCVRNLIFARIEAELPEVEAR